MKSRNLPYDRTQRIADSIYDLVSEIVQRELSDPRLADVTITRVRLTKDMRLARVNYLVSPPTDDAKKTALEGLNSAKGYLRKVVAESISFKFVPDLCFYYDDAMEEGNKVEELLKIIAREGRGEK